METNLTNEELEDGKCERCHGPVEKKMKLQWNLAITKYADRLIDDLALVDYPERVKTEQIKVNTDGEKLAVGQLYGLIKDFLESYDIVYEEDKVKIDLCIKKIYLSKISNLTK